MRKRKNGPSLFIYGRLDWQSAAMPSRVGLSQLPHPYHWASGLIGGVVGILVGWVWYRWRGDVL
jgi:hypothetical protein